MINKIKLLDNIESNTKVILTTVNLVIALIVRSSNHLLPILAIASIFMLIIFSVLQTYNSFLSTTRYEAIKSIRKLF